MSAAGPEEPAELAVVAQRSEEDGIVADDKDVVIEYCVIHLPLRR